MAKILLVEDDKSLREIYGVRLQAEGYDIVSAGDGEEALAMAIKDRPDLIISDVMMPKISGFDMLDILRSTTETKDIKVIMMTALSSEDQRARGEALGADRYLVKSQVGIEDVVRTVHDVLGDSLAPAGAPRNAFAPPAPSAVARPVAPTPAAPVVAPIVQPVMPAAPIAPVPTPVAAPAPTPVVPGLSQPPVAPVEPVFAPTPVVTPPAATPAPVEPLPTPPVFTPVAPAPVEPVAPVATPVTPEPVSAVQNGYVAPPTQELGGLPEPTAPFSTPRPASLGERVIHPLESNQSVDMASLINQELSGAPVPPAVPLPPEPTIPDMPPQPPVPPVAPTV